MRSVVRCSESNRIEGPCGLIEFDTRARLASLRTTYSAPTSPSQWASTRINVATRVRMLFDRRFDARRARKEEHTVNPRGTGRVIRFGVMAGLAGLLAGSATECATVLRLADGNSISTPRSGHGGVHVGQRHVTHFESTPGMRLEMVGTQGELDGTEFSRPDEIEDLEALASTTVTPRIYGHWWSFGQYGPSGRTSLDLVGTLANEYVQTDLVEYATTNDEGVCSITVPWLSEDIDPVVAGLLGDSLGAGLAELIVDGFDRGMAPRLGSQDSLADQAWFADFSTSMTPDPARNTQLLPDWNVEPTGAADHRMCIRSYFLFSGEIDWTPRSPGEVFQWIGGGWIPDVFRVGDCPGNRGTAITICGRFDVTEPRDQVYAGDQLIDAKPGAIAFRVDQVRAWMNRFPRIRVGCNNAKPDFEAGIEEVFRSLIEPSFAAMAGDFASALPFNFEDAYQTAEGLTLVIALDETDPDYGLADWLGLCAQRSPQNGTYSTVLWEGEPRID
jgi:hypothetical protein